MVGFSKKEYFHIAVSSLFLSFAFTFNKWGDKTFSVSSGIKNLLLFLILIGVFILVREFGRKIVAKRYEALVEYRIWFIKRIGFQKHSELKTQIPIGIILSLLVALISLGRVFFCAVGTFIVSRTLVSRLGYKRANLMEYEIAKIALAGPIVSLLLAVVLKLFVNFTDYNLIELVKINVYLAFFNMLPLPGLDGFKVFFGSRYLYNFGLVFIGVAGFLLFHLSVLLTLILALLLAVILLILFYVLEVSPSLKP